MKTIFSILFLVLIGSVSASAGQDECWYNAQGKDPERVSGNPANAPAGVVTRVKESGPRAMFIIVENGASCAPMVQAPSGMGGLAYSN